MATVAVDALLNVFRPPMIDAMKAVIIAVGSELLGTERVDTNSLRLTKVLEAHGVELLGKSVVGDDVELLAAELRQRLATADLVFLTGGLGPTSDDVTRPAVAAALERELTIDEGFVAVLEQRFASFGRKMSASNRRQAERISGADLLDNDRGTAPGMRLDDGAATIFLFPGVPRELEGMIERHLEPWLRQRPAGPTSAGISRCVVKVACLPESEVEERLQPVYQRFGRADLCVLASPGEVRLHLSARGPAAEREQRLDDMRRAVLTSIGQAAFTDREDETLELVVGSLLERAGKTLVTAESCTGGLLAERLTRMPGSSCYFLGGVVSYSNELKIALLDVPTGMLAAHGAVSEEVGVAMARGARRRYGSDYGIGITGVAGPGGGSEAKPVGTVHVALAGPGEEDVAHRRVRLPGDRQLVRVQTVQLALEMLRRDLLRRSDASDGEAAQR